MDAPAPLELDVRPLIAAKKAPLGTVLDAVARLAPGQALRLTAPFEPLPLYQVLSRQGFQHEATHDGAGTWTIVFRK